MLSIKRSSLKSFKYVATAARLYSSLPLQVPVTLPNGLKYIQPTGLFINNEFVASQNSHTFAVLNPSTEEEITHVYEAREEDVDIAVEAASKAFKSSWSTQDPIERSKVMYKLAELIDENHELISSIESLDNGKSMLCARTDVRLVANYIRSCAGFADKIYGKQIETGNTHFNYTKREPLGVCGQIIPWNFPLLMWSWKIGPALATGNTVVLKPAESTPLSALFVSTLVKEAGIPPGVINIVSGFGKNCGNAIASHPKIKKIAFTGSTATGRTIMKAAADSNLKKITLELGGKSPNIVFSDADIDQAVKNIAIGIFYNSGEVCCAGSRVYVQDTIYEKFNSALTKHVESLVVGDPFHKDTFQGSQTSIAQMNKILSYVKIGKDEGATLLSGGERLGSIGYFIKPTIFTNVTEQMRIVKEEIFGPFVTISKFSTVDEVVDMANDSEYGLAAGIHTSDLNKAIDVSNRVNAGTVWVNTYNDFHQQVPFGGFGQSGIGREMGEEALDNYTQVKAVRIAITKQEK